MLLVEVSVNKKTLYGVDKTLEVKEWSVWTEDDTVIVEWGKLDGKKQTKKTICKAKNVGRSNETTPEQQAISEAQSKWNKQVDKYYRESIEEAKSLLTEGVMLAQDYSKKPHFLEDEFYASRKLDGLRVKTVFVNGEPEWHSRGGKKYPVPEHIIPQLKQLRKDTGLDCYDGEGYVSGVKLQKIQSCIKKHNELTPKVTYEIFDIPMLNTPWEERNEHLESMKPFIENLSHINIVEQELTTKGNLDNILHKYLSEGFEGVMLRNKNGEYEFQNKRSNDLLKYKIMEDSEAKVISCEEDKNGQGKFMMEWLSPYNDEIVHFELSMNGSHEDNTYEKLSKRIGEWVSFKYQDFTEDGKPSFARGLYFRECDGNGNPLE